MKKLTRRNFIKGLAVAGATLSPVGKVVQLQELKCANCSAPLVITGEFSCGCEYCGARYAVTNLDEIVKAEEEPNHRWNDSDYFWDGINRYPNELENPFGDE